MSSPNTSNEALQRWVEGHWCSREDLKGILGKPLAKPMCWEWGSTPKVKALLLTTRQTIFEIKIWLIWPLEGKGFGCPFLHIDTETESLSEREKRWLQRTWQQHSQVIMTDSEASQLGLPLEIRNSELPKNFARDPDSKPNLPHNYWSLKWIPVSYPLGRELESRGELIAMREVNSCWGNIREEIPVWQNHVVRSALKSLRTHY